jgi:hypothetical protein
MNFYEAWELIIKRVSKKYESLNISKIKKLLNVTLPWQDSPSI